jgi:AcrR family transcriptional regulator
VTTGAKTDGRAARGQRTREAIVDAFLSLIEEGIVRPSMEEVAARAGVSRRAIFHHFGPDALAGTRESLPSAAWDRQAQRIAALTVHLPDTGPLDKRLDAFVDQRSRVLEFVTPVRRAALQWEPFSRTVARRLQDIRALKRAEVERVFATELAARPAPERAELAAALCAAAAWTAWETLRKHQDLPYARAQATMRRTLAALLKAEA